MTWTHIPHNRCVKPLLLFAVFIPTGSIWTCDTCGKRWRLTRTADSDGRPQVAWQRADLTGLEIAQAIREAETARMSSTEISDVAWRERRAALAHLHRGFDALYVELGLERKELSRG